MSQVKLLNRFTDLAYSSSCRLVRESVEEEKSKWESCNRTTAQATATNACRVIRQAAEALKVSKRSYRTGSPR